MILSSAQLVLRKFLAIKVKSYVRLDMKVLLDFFHVLTFKTLQLNVYTLSL